MNINNEINPPWVEFPNYGPGDCFWRQSGEAWFYFVWFPYWQSLSKHEQDEYLIRWNVPYDWNKFYFDHEFKKWLEEIDKD